MFQLEQSQEAQEMIEKPFDIGVFVSTPSVGDNIKRIAAHNTNIRISHKGLEEAIPAAKQMEKEGIEVIISRAGTSSLLRENLRVPVLSFPQSSMDALISLKEARRKGRKIFMPSFRNRRSGIEIMGELLDIEFAQDIYTDLASLRQIICRAVQDGFEVIVGGIATMRYATEFDAEFCELISSEEEVIETIENAKSVVQSQREQKATARRYQAIMDAASDGILAVDPNGTVTTINQTAQRILNMRRNDAVGAPITRIIPQSAVNQVLQDKTAVRDKVERIKNEMFVFNHTPVLLGEEVIGVVSSFKEVSHVMRAENTVRRTLTKGFVAKYVIDDLIHQHPSMQKVVALCREFAKTDSCILITGETGTGKEIIAQGIHNLSQRKTRPFVSVHCAALPEQLLENELFGHEEGAFTGSKKGGKPGLFELAHQGTVFLDEIDSTSLNVQLRLLRALQEKEVMRVGAEHKVPIDVRVIAAAGKDLWKAVQEGAFRKDLFFRLNVLRISVPPLRARKEDIPELLEHFLDYYVTKHNIDAKALPTAYQDKLMDYSWPGNVRQLKHFAEQLLLNCSFHFSEETLDELLDELTRIVDPEQQLAKKALPTQAKEHQLQTFRYRIDAERIMTALEEARFNKARAAEMLGISRTTLWRKMKEFKLG